MAEFRTMLEELGAERARTYIASGNAVIELPDDSLPADYRKFDRTVEDGLEARFGFRREAYSRSIDELVAGVDEHPFAVDNPAWSYIMFLNEEPTIKNIASASEVATGDDEWAVCENHLHLRYSEGMSKATLKLDTLVKRLGVVGTARNLRTVQAIIDLARR